MKENLENILKNSKIIKLDVTSEIFNERNSWIHKDSKNFCIHCLGLMYLYNFTIDSLCLSEGKIGNFIEIYKVELMNFAKEEDFGIPKKNIVENSAICINLITIPLFFNYINGMVLKRGEKADYILYSNNYNFTFESKGVSSQYNCPKKIEEGEKQILNSFEVLKDSNIKFGIVGESCFYEQIHHLVKINNVNFKYKVGLEMDGLKQIINKSSQLITKAMTLKDMGKNDEAKETYKLATQKESEIASKLDEFNSKEAKLHWISAISCASEAEEYQTVILWINDFETREDLHQNDKVILDKLKIKAQTHIKLDKERILSKSITNRLIRYIIFLNEEKFKKIQGKGNIIKELFFVRENFLDYGFNLPIRYSISRNPIFSKELSDQIQMYINTKFLIKNVDKSLNLSESARKMVKNEKTMTERIIKKNYSEDLIQKMLEIVDKLGNKTSSELEKIEEKIGITSFQFGKRIL